MSPLMPDWNREKRLFTENFQFGSVFKRKCEGAFPLMEKNRLRYIKPLLPEHGISYAEKSAVDFIFTKTKKRAG